MKTGLVVGKFMPLHVGHIGLVEFAAARCDKLYVAVCTRDFEPIPGTARYAWALETFMSLKNVEVMHIEAPLPDAPYPSESVSRAWAEYFKLLNSNGRIDKINTVFSSEDYGVFFAKHLEAEHVMYDNQRVERKISATMIREKPISNWDSIAPCARSYFSKKICIYGSESTGKSTLVKNLASEYATSFVHETACDLFPDRHCTYEDLERVATLHFGTVSRKLMESNKVLFVDTDLIVTQVYSQQYFGKVPESTKVYQRKESYDGYLFCDIDVPWVDENFRDLGHMRQFMRDWFLSELMSRGITPFFVCGDWENRMRMAELAVTTILRQPFKPHSF